MVDECQRRTKKLPNKIRQPPTSINMNQKESLKYNENRVGMYQNAPIEQPRLKIVVGAQKLPTYLPTVPMYALQPTFTKNPQIMPENPAQCTNRPDPPNTLKIYHSAATQNCASPAPTCTQTGFLVSSQNQCEIWLHAADCLRFEAAWAGPKLDPPLPPALHREKQHTPQEV